MRNDGVGMTEGHKFVFVIGVEKCGTTSLYRAMQDSKQFNLPQRKETFYFSSGYEKGPEYFESLFSKPFDARDYNIDITPIYHRSVKTLERIAQFEAQKKIVICLRNPTERAFSHYIHDIRHHVCLGQRSDDFRRIASFSFHDLWAARSPTYFLRYAPCLRDAFDRFGRDNCHVVILENLFEDWDTEAGRLDAFLEFETPVLSGRRFPHVNRNRSLPYMFQLSEAEGGRYRLAQKHYGGVRIFENLDRDQARNALTLQGSFTPSLSQTLANDIAHWFDQDIEEVESLVGMDLSVWHETQPISYPYATVEREDAKKADSGHGAAWAHIGHGLREI